MTGEFPTDDLSIKFSGEAAALINSEAIIEGCEPRDIVIDALTFYRQVVPELRHGAKLVLEIDNSIELSRMRTSPIKRLGRAFMRLAGGNPGVERRSLSWTPRITQE